MLIFSLNIFVSEWTNIVLITSNYRQCVSWNLYERHAQKMKQCLHIPYLLTTYHTLYIIVIWKYILILRYLVYNALAVYKVNLFWLWCSNLQKITLHACLLQLPSTHTFYTEHSRIWEKCSVSNIFKPLYYGNKRSFFFNAYIMALSRHQAYY